MPSRSAVYAQARKHAEVEKSVFAALTKRAAEERDALLKRRKAEDTLPIELWLRILSLLDDCNLLWSSCRQVSKSFRHCVDTIFRDDHIRNAKTLITFDVGDEASNGSPASSEIQLVFDRFSTDGSRAFFTELADTTQDSELQKASTEQWKSIMKKDSADRCQDPPYTIAVRRFVNDTDIPQLEIDFEKRAISFDWRAMYTCFFREEDWIEKQQALWAHDKLALSKKRHLEANEVEELAAMKALVDQLEDVFDCARKEIRRRRIRKWYSEHKYLLDWSQECDERETRKLEQMRDERGLSGYLVFSDEESD